jgi:hypothetical protein
MALKSSCGCEALVGGGFGFGALVDLVGAVDGDGDGDGD